jgi:hypothetical protein
MKNLDLKDVLQYVEENISIFHQKKIDRLKQLKLDTVLKKKNSYLFKAKNVGTSDQIVRSIMEAFASSNEETIFGDWLEGLAIFVNQKVYGGQKSSAMGIDLEFDKDGIRYLVAIKSGPNWGNSSQVKRMQSDFKTAIKTLRTSNSKLHVVAVNGCCYGRDNHPNKGDYFKYCGQEFWEFISGDPNLFIDIIEPLGFKSKERNESFLEEYNKLLTKFSIEFGNSYVKEDGSINWEKLVAFNSGKIITA